MVDLIESVLENEDLRVLIENAEPTGSIRQADLAEFLELHPLDPLEVDALYRELDQRGIEVAEEKEREPAPPPVVQQLSYETTTDALQLFLREAGRHALLTAAQERVAAGLAQEELERVGRRLVGELLHDRRRRRLALLLLGDLDPALVELPVERVDLERVERVELEELGEIGLADRAGGLR